MEEKTESHAIISEPRRKRWIIYFSIFTFLAIFLYFFYWLLSSRYYVYTDDSYVIGNQIQIMPQISGQVLSILADETSLVTQGEPVIFLDKTDTEIALKKAELQLAITVQEISQLYENVYQLKANLKVQQSDFLKAHQDYERRKNLTVGKFISVEELQHAQISMERANAALASVQHQLNAILAVVGTTDLYHHPKVQSAVVAVRNAYLNWRRTTIYAPATGYVAKRPVQVGQQVTPRSVLMVIVPLNQLWVAANFKETELAHIRIGQPAELISDMYDSKVIFEGTVAGLSPGTGSAFDLLPPQNATGNWIKIVQRLPVRIHFNSLKQLERYPLRIGLSMRTSIDTRDRSGNVLVPFSQHKVIYETKNYSSDNEQATALINQILEKNAKNMPSPALPEKEKND